MDFVYLPLQHAQYKMLQKLLKGNNVLIFALIINVLVHLPFINLGPRSVHAWRQSNTLAVAKNFYTEDMNILKPRVDRRLDSDGVTGMQFPSYEYVLAKSYQIFGFHNANHRLWSLLISCLGAIAMFLLTKKLLKNELAAGFAALAYCFSPDLFYFGFSALPDILALASSVWGLYLFLCWFESKKYQHYFLSLFFICLAGLTKIQFLAIGFFIAPFILQNKKEIIQHIWSLLLFGLCAVIIPLAWYNYAVDLIKSSGLEDFGITFRPEKDLINGLQTIFKNLSNDLPDLLLNYASFLLFIYAIYLFFKNRFWKNTYFIPMLCWTLALIIYHIIELAQMNVHSYYMMPYIPVLILMVAYAVKHIQLLKRANTILLIVLFAEPILASTRIIPSRFTKPDPGIPMELYDDATRLKLVNATKNELCIVGPDISGCIYFYHLEKKGFGFNQKEDLFIEKNNARVIDDYIKRGAQYLYSNDTSLANDIYFKPYIKTVVTKVGNFSVYQLQ